MMDVVLRIILLILGLQAIALMFFMGVHKLNDISGDAIFDQEEIHKHCTVVIWTNSKTGAQSFAWMHEPENNEGNENEYE